MSLTLLSTKLYIYAVSLQWSLKSALTVDNIDENDYDLNLNIYISRSECIGGFYNLLNDPNCFTSASIMTCSHYSLFDYEYF